MLPLILAAGSMFAGAAGQNAANAASAAGAQTQADINLQAIAQRKKIQDDILSRNKPYYDNGVAQLPSIEAMSRNPDFSTIGPEFGDKYSQGAYNMMLNGIQHGVGRDLVPLSELNGNFNRSEQGRLLDRRLDSLKVGYGQAGTAGQNLMTTGSAIADINNRIGNIQANAKSLQSLNRQNMINDNLNDVSYAPMYANYKWGK